MKFKSLIAAMAVLFVFSMAAQAQDEYNKVEGYAGYAYLKSDIGLGELVDGTDVNFDSHGFNGSVTGNFHRYVGAKFDYSYHTKSRNFDEIAVGTSVSAKTQQFLGGLQFKDNSKEGGRFRPFAHVLAGLANQKLSGSSPVIPTPTEGTSVSFDESSNSFAMVIGGGIDVKLSKNVDLRIIQVDYNPIWRGDQAFFDDTIPSATQSNVRIGFGIAFH